MDLYKTSPVKTSKISISEKSSSSLKDGRKKTYRPRHLMKRRNDINIFYDNVNVTPKLLEILETEDSKPDYLSLSQLEVRSHYELSIFGNLSASVLQSHIHTQSIASVSQISYGSMLKEDIMDETEAGDSEQYSQESFFEEGQYFVARAMPSKINIVLCETPVLYLLEITSTTEIKGTSEGTLVEVDNEHYDYLTIGKGRNRKTTDAEIQTYVNLLKTRSTVARRPKRNNDYAFASMWDMYDTYDQENQETATMSVPEELTIFEDSELLDDSEDQMKKLVQNPNFQHCVLVMERVLANNVYNQQQKRFRGIIAQDPFRPNIEFKYDLDLLWTFKSLSTKGHPVTTMQWHPINNDILAVGYGIFFYTEKKPGTVYCWNVKNPSQPEREFHFKIPVTSLSFSPFEPNLLAVGLYDGTVAILDICRKNVEMLMVTTPSTTSSYQPIWAIEWFLPDDYNINDNHVITVCEDGKVSGFIATKTNDLIQIPMLTTYATEAKIKGVYQPKQCAANEIPVLKAVSAITITKHPIENSVFYVGTGEGTIHQCSENYQNQHVDVFMAHTGPVYGQQFSHFCSKLFLTCGADSCINIWIDNLKEPLVSLSISFSPIDGAEWCPANSTIIANICGNIIYLWDLQRKTYKPTSEHVNPMNCRNTSLKFSPSGKNLAIGDIEGNVHIFTLTDIPFPPFYQAQMLEQVMYKNMITKPELVTQVKNSGLIYRQGSMRIIV